MFTKFEDNKQRKPRCTLAEKTPKTKSEYLLSLLGPRLQRDRNGAGPYVLALPLTVSSACLLSVENFRQRISLFRGVRDAETKENSQKRINNNNVVIKHSQGPLVLSQGL